MINFATLQGLTIPEGVVTQITDASGRVLWALSGGKVVLQVEKITSNTYVSSTSYTNEQFILLNIYPKTASGGVKVTYGDLTKTIAFTSTGAHQVYFGTYGGVADSVATPASGTLTVEGDCVGVCPASYNTGKNTTDYCKCIVDVVEWGNIEKIGSYMFYNRPSLTTITIPDGVTSIGDSAFYNCTSLTSIIIPGSVTSIGGDVFKGCTSLTNATILHGVPHISGGMFEGCTSLASVTIPGTVTEIGGEAFYGTVLGSITLPDSLTSIGNSAFASNKRLTEITIPKNVTFMSYDIFSSCDALTKVVMLSTTPPSTSSSGNMFRNADNLTTIIVPAGCGDIYKTTSKWDSYASLIVEASA